MLTRHSFALLCGLFAAGCATSSSQKQVESAANTPQAANEGPFGAEMPSSGHYKGRNNFSLASSGPVQCRFSPHFAMGSSEPLPQNMADLKELADCLNSEDAKDRPIEIVGHSDVGGSSIRNLKLSLARAERIRDILESHGVDPKRMQVRSVGERAALGYLSGYSNGFDRRVDVALIYDVREPADTNRYDVAAWR